MRLVVWNCMAGLDSLRSSALAALNPDVAIVCEAKQGLVWPMELDPPSSFYWAGDNPNKGLAVLSFGTWTSRPRGEPSKAPWVLPVEVEGPRNFTLLATWAVQAPGSGTYATQVTRATEAYRSELSSGQAVLAGDLNCSAQTKDPKPHFANVGRLQELGLDSAYHLANDTEPGNDDPGTLFFMWDRDRPYHCDLAFIPVTWRSALRSVTLGSYEDWVATRVSDHVPVIIDIDDPTGPSAVGC